MVSIKQKLKNSPGYFKKQESIVELPPTPKKAKTGRMSMKKTLFKDLISAKYAEKDLLKDTQFDNITKSSVETSPFHSNVQSPVESPTPDQKLGLGEASSIDYTAQRVKVTPKSAPRTMVGKVSPFRKSFSVANTPKGAMDFLKQLKDSKKIVKNSPKVIMTTPRSSNTAQRGSTSSSSLSIKQTSIRKTVSAFQSVAKSAQSVKKQPSILDASKDVFFEQIQGFVGYSKAPVSEKSCGKVSPELESNRRRSVTFGPPVRFIFLID